MRLESPPPRTALNAAVRRPLVSVGIPAYNRPELLRETLASLAAQEKFADFEVVVCDDLGLAATRAAVENSGLARVRYIRNVRPLGAVANWNRTIAESTGEWVSVLHEDDLLYPWFFDMTVPRLRPSLAAIAVRCTRGETPPSLTRPAYPPAARRYLRPYFLKSAFTPFPGVLFPRRLALDLGGFDVRMGPLADYEFWYRLSGYGEVEVLAATGAFYRVTNDQWTTRTWPEMLRRTHLLRLRIAHEQFRGRPRLARWLARFFTRRNASAYASRFTERPTVLRRIEQFDRIPFRRLPSGWVWSALRWLARWPTASAPRAASPRSSKLSALSCAST
jgi:glycosyltransferase involved in cell wall biosynthesis